MHLKRRQVSTSAFKRGTYFRLLVGAFMWYLFYLNAVKVSTLEGMQSFDPFQILDIPNDATIRDIRKQYRRLSLEKHPDKNPDDPLAVQEFIRLTKAYNVSYYPTCCFKSLSILLCHNSLLLSRFLPTIPHVRTSVNTETPTVQDRTTWPSRCLDSCWRKTTRSRYFSALSSFCWLSCLGLCTSTSATLPRRTTAVFSLRTKESMALCSMRTSSTRTCPRFLPAVSNSKRWEPRTKMSLLFCRS